MQPVPTLPLIPTRYKTKIPHTHSWPMGAEAISKALAGVPQFERLELVFSTPYKFQPHFTNYSVLDVSYTKYGNFFSASQEMVERGWTGPGWQITVKPVRRSQRYAIQTQLLERGLPFAKKWLDENTVADRTRRNMLSFSWDEDTKVLGYKVEENLEPERI